MMVGGHETFGYFQCSVCECLQIKEQPGDMTPYYAGDYYSHRHAPSGMRGALKAHRDRYSLTGRGLIGRLLNAVFPNQAMQSLQSLHLSPAARILDVGCGAGALLHALQAGGFRNLLGVDPFAEANSAGNAAVEIRKQSISEVDGIFDVVMFHHSFEHLWEPADALSETFRLLDNDGCCVIRIPVVPSYVWERYGVNWVQLDAPRHFYLHSMKSMHRLALAAGFEIERVVFDSTAFQFWGSEQYEKGIPLQDERSFFVNPFRSSFSIPQILGFARKASALNRSEAGDQASFYLKKSRKSEQE